MFNFLRVSTAVPSVTVANVNENLISIEAKVKEAANSGSKLIVLPELALTGYTCEDLFFQTTLINKSVEGLGKIIELSSKYKAILVVGLPLKIDGELYNCAAVVAAGVLCGIVPKTFPSNNSSSMEKRWFSSSEDLKAFEVSVKDLGLKNLGDYVVPVGRDLVFNAADYFKFAVEIGDDSFSVLSPSAFLALDGAEVIVNLSAEGETVSQREYRRNTLKNLSKRGFCSYIMSSAGSNESTSDLIFAGHSVIANSGKILAENKSFIDNDYVLSADIDLQTIRQDRLNNKTFKDARFIYSDYEPARTVYIDFNDDLSSDGKLLNISKTPFIPLDETERNNRVLDIFNMQVAGLRRRAEITGNKLVVGVSGGLDSTLALLVAAKTMKSLNRPLTDVYGITMPCFGTSGRTYNNSKSLIESLGLTFKCIDIKDSCIKHFEDIGHDINVLDVTYENAQARERTQVLMDFAGEIGGFVVGTGDLSELALGWCTYNGDHMSMYGVNSDIPKTLLKYVIEGIVKNNIFPESNDVLLDILDTPISPELLPPSKAGDIAQVTEDIVGPYILHDFFLYHILRYGFEPKKILFLAEKAFQGEFSKEIIIKWLKTFYRRFFTQQFKRDCLPDGVKIGSIGLSPRSDWHMPSDASAKLWLNEIEEI